MCQLAINFPHSTGTSCAKVPEINERKGFNSFMHCSCLKVFLQNCQDQSKVTNWYRFTCFGQHKRSKRWFVVLASFHLCVVIRLVSLNYPQTIHPFSISFFQVCAHIYITCMHITNTYHLKKKYKPKQTNINTEALACYLIHRSEIFGARNELGSIKRKVKHGGFGVEKSNKNAMTDFFTCPQE